MKNYFLCADGSIVPFSGVTFADNVDATRVNVSTICPVEGLAEILLWKEEGKRFLAEFTAWLDAQEDRAERSLRAQERIADAEEHSAILLATALGVTRE